MCFPRKTRLLNGRKYARHVLSFLGGEKAFGEKQRQCWAFQIRNHWQVAWQIWPMLSGKELATARATFPPLLEKNAQATDWNANFQLVSHRLESRRRTRDFSAWQNPLQGHRDHFSGKEQAIIDDAWLAKAQNPTDPRNLRFLFRNNDELGAVNLVKRVWHKAYLEPQKRLKRARRAFDSVPDVAAAPWRELLRTKLLSPTPPEGLDAAFAEFTHAVQRAGPFLDKDYEEVQRSIPLRGDSDYETWLKKADLAIFNQTTWETEGAEPDAKSRLEEASKRLAGLLAGVYKLGMQKREQMAIGRGFE